MQTTARMTAALLVSTSLFGCSRTVGPSPATGPVIVVGEKSQSPQAKLAPVAAEKTKKDQADERKKALEEAAEFGLIGLLGPADGQDSVLGSLLAGNGTTQLSGPVGIIGGPSAGMGGLSMGAGGLGLSGIGTGGGQGFGIGSIGTIGHGSGFGSSYRYGERPKAQIDSAVTEGPLPQDAVQRILSDHRDDFQDCCELEAASGSVPRGTVMLAFTINPEGKVIEVRTPEATISSQSLKACVAQTLGAIDFPQSKAAENVRVLVNVSF